MSSTCKYCNQLENKQTQPGLVCEICSCFVHLSCLRRPGTPGNFDGDVFFDFVCEHCSENGSESFGRNKFPWVNVIILALHHLSVQAHGTSKHGFFHYKENIAHFIHNNWSLLFEPQFKQKKNWVGTIACKLSTCSDLFCSGTVELGETGWWKLRHTFSPAVLNHIILEMAKNKPKGRQKGQLESIKVNFIDKAIELGYEDLISEVEPAAKKRRLEENHHFSDTNCIEQHAENGFRDDERVLEDIDNTLMSTEAEYSDAETSFKGFDSKPSTSSQHLLSADSKYASLLSSQTSNFYEDSDSRSRSSYNLPNDVQSDYEEKPTVQHQSVKDDIKEKTKKTRIEEPVRRESLFSTELNSVGLPWVEEQPKRRSNLVEMNKYQEAKLLKEVEGLIPLQADPNKKAYLYRLRAKLRLRQLKRQRRMPLFNLDAEAAKADGRPYPAPEPPAEEEAILDRYQKSYLMDKLSGTIANTNYGTILVSHIDPEPVRSMYTGSILHRFIHRGVPPRTPLWLQLMDELLIRTHRHIKDYKPPSHAVVDYSYVRIQHIAAVNNLLSQHFWPGIDMTEALQYPDFSCVVTYKKLLVACAFMVPDVGPNENYISFVFTRPGWRNCEIAGIMLYHLFQLSHNKDVTLHVAPTNPAVILLQKFKFKIDEMVKDFYDKYYDIDYKGCRHALYMRMPRSHLFRDNERVREDIDNILMFTKAEYSDAETSFKGIDSKLSTSSQHLLSADSKNMRLLSSQASNFYEDFDSRSRSSYNLPNDVQSDYEEKPTVQHQSVKEIKPEKTKKTRIEEPVRRESLFSTELNSVGLPWVEEQPKRRSNLVEMNKYQEAKLLKEVEGLIPLQADPNKKAYLYRLRAKLRLRQLKRQRRMPLFNLDAEAAKADGRPYPAPEPPAEEEAVLDRYQKSYLMDKLSGTIANTNYGTILVSHIDPKPVRSMYTGSILHRFIHQGVPPRTPLWLQLMDELLIRTHRHIKDYKPPSHAVVDYSYVRIQHIAAVNNLLSQHFWPGIDMTESLQYPDFSCVVTYKKLLVACAFMVPDVGPNENYISFVFTKPGWRNCDIAGIMLYFLFQSCNNKDVTLHVARTNPAVILYQKFGFKIDEMVKDFYDKYYDIDYKGCRHALYMRMPRSPI